MQSDFQIPQGKPSKPIPPAGPKKASTASSGDSVPTPSIDFPEVKAESQDTAQDQAPTKPEYSPEELLRVFDEIIFSGEYSEEFLIRGKLRVRFRTRTSEEIDEVQKTLDNQQFNLISSVDQFKQVMSLTQALVEYGTKDMSSMKFPEKAKFVQSLPGPMVGGLLGLLLKFDQKVYLACQEGEANF